MASKDLYFYVNDVGQKIKTSGLSFNQNSTNSLIHFITVGYFKAITATFRTADGELSANYNVPLAGKYSITTDDTEAVLVNNASNLYEYTLYIPYKVSSTFITASSSRISVAFHAFNYDSRTKVLINTMTANTQIVLNRADDSGTLDESYNATDVNNLWKTVNDLNYTDDEQNASIAANTASIQAETTRAKAAESTLQTNINTNTTSITNEVTRAKAAESTLQTNINNEATTRANADTTLQTNINTTNSSLSTETSAREAADTSLQSSLTAETTRATTAETTLTNTKQNISDKGIANGYASLDDTGKVPSTQLPSYVDDVIEYESKTDFSTTGENGKIYVAKDTNLTYRWSGSAYVEISESLALGETSSTAYAGDKGKATTDKLTAHVADTNNPHNVTKTQVGLSNVDNTSDADKPISTATQTAINNEATTRMNADTALQTNLTAESNTRLANDGALDKRVTNLENAAEGKIYTTTTDSTAAYMKSIPDSSCSYGLVSKIYGRDRVCTNIKTQTSSYRPYIFTWKYGINTFEFSGTVSQNYWPASKLSTENLVVGKTYTLKATSNQSIYAPVICIILNGTSTNYDSSYTFTFAEGMTIYVYYNLLTSTEITIDIITYIQLSEGSTALPYEPYFSGFYNNTPNKVIARGTNLINEASYISNSNYKNYIDSLAFTGGKIVLTTNSTAAQNAYINVETYINSKYSVQYGMKIMLKPNTTYTLSGDLFTMYYIGFFDKNDYCISLDWSAMTSTYVKTFTTPANTTYITLRSQINNATASTTYTGNIMLNEGSTALTYAAYTESNIDISSLGKTLHGGSLTDASANDCLDLVNKTLTRNTAQVTLDGTETWVETTKTFYSELKPKVRMSNNAHGFVGPDSNYTFQNYCVNVSKNLALTLSDLKTYLAANHPVIIVPLFTPTVEALSITDDYKFYPSTSLGSLTFENDKKDDVLSEVATEVKVA